ncbi:MAG: nitroreductase [Saprospiraceae bacterium]|nr:nitroreductase [Saprospiraceae bacterium]
MNQKFTILTEVIRSRRAIFPQFYESGQISDDILDSILENARWAPTHKKTEPWRFVIIKNEKLQDLSNFLGAFYKSKTTDETFDPIKMKKAGEKALQAACVIAICIHRSPETLIPAWEETAALACAVQNIWLSCASLDIGSYWSTPEAIQSMNLFLNLDPNESCLGLFYMGWSKYQPPASIRKPLSEIVKRMG